MTDFDSYDEMVQSHPSQAYHRFHEDEEGRKGITDAVIGKLLLDWVIEKAWDDEVKEMEKEEKNAITNTKSL